MLKPCVEIKVDGKQCTRDAKIGERCTQHHNMHLKKNTNPIFEKLNLPEPDPKIGSKFVKKIRSRLEKGVLDSDGPGFIYIYYIESEKGLNKWKIGKTTRDLDERLAEWTEAHGKKNTVRLHKSYKLLKGTDFVERNIHNYFKHWNIYRYQQEDGSFYDEYAMSGDPVDEQEKKKVSAKGKHIEWFMGDINEIKAVLQKLVEYCNDQK